MEAVMHGGQERKSIADQHKELLGVAKAGIRDLEVRLRSTSYPKCTVQHRKCTALYRIHGYHHRGSRRCADGAQGVAMYRRSGLRFKFTEQAAGHRRGNDHADSRHWLQRRSNAHFSCLLRRCCSCAGWSGLTDAYPMRHMPQLPKLFSHFISPFTFQSSIQAIDRYHAATDKVRESPEFLEHRAAEKAAERAAEARAYKKKLHNMAPKVRLR